MSAILSVDDSRLMRNIMRSVVESLGYDFLEAGNGQEGWDAVEARVEDIELILLDVNMPVMDGFTLLEKLKNDDRYRHIPAMMVTTESERQQMIRGLKKGAVNYVCKPFTHEELSTKIVESLGQGLGF